MVRHKKKIELELYNSICSAFENLTFAAVEQESERDNFDLSENELVYRSDISIKNRGADFLLKLIIPTEYLNEIFSTVYPDVEMTGNAGIIDIMAELANTIAGHLMLNIESTTGPFEIGLPIVEKGKGIDGSPFISNRYLVGDTYVVATALYER
jgi:hypothetical protein